MIDINEKRIEYVQSLKHGKKLDKKPSYQNIEILSDGYPLGMIEGNTGNSFVNIKELGEKPAYVNHRMSPQNFRFRFSDPDFKRIMKKIGKLRVLIKKMGLEGLKEDLARKVN